MTLVRSVLLVGLVVPLSLGPVFSSPPTARERPHRRNVSPVETVEPEDDSPWSSRLDRAGKAAERPEKVIEILEKITLDSPAPPPEACEMLARAYIALSRLDDADAVLQHGLKTEPTSKLLLSSATELEFTFGKSKLEEGVFKQAKVHFKRLLASTPTTGPGRQMRERVAAAYRQTARALDATGDHERAVGILKESLELDPENPQSIRLLGNVLRGASRTKDAISFYELYMMYVPDDREMAGELIGLYHEVADEAKAQELTAKFPGAVEATVEATRPTELLPPVGASSVQVAPTVTDFAGDLATARNDKAKAEVHAGHARGAQASKDYKTAVDHFRRALELDPGNRALTMSLAEVLRLYRRPEQARELYEDLLIVDERDHAARFQLGKMLVASGQPQEALPNLRRLAIEPSLDRETLISTYNWLGIAYAQLSDYTAAEDAWREVLRIDPRFANAHYNVGQIREKQHRPDETIAAFEKAVEFGERDPDFLRYLERLGLAYRQAGKLQAANDVWLRLTASAPAGSAQAARAGQFLTGAGSTTPAGPEPAASDPDEWPRGQTQERAKLPEAIPQVREADCLAAADRAFREGLVDEALRQYGRAVALNPAKAETYFKLGDLLHQKGELVRERALFERMLRQKLTPEMEQAARFRLQGLGKR